MVISNYGHKYIGPRAISEICLFEMSKINIWTIFGDIFKFLSRPSHFTTWHDQWRRNRGFRRFNEPGAQAPGGRRVWGPKNICKKRILYYRDPYVDSGRKMSEDKDLYWIWMNELRLKITNFLKYTNAVLDYTFFSFGLHIFRLGLNILVGIHA